MTEELVPYATAAAQNQEGGQAVPVPKRYAWQSPDDVAYPTTSRLQRQAKKASPKPAAKAEEPAADPQEVARTQGFLEGFKYALEQVELRSK